MVQENVTHASSSIHNRHFASRVVAECDFLGAAVASYARESACVVESEELVRPAGELDGRKRMLVGQTRAAVVRITGRLSVIALNADQVLVGRVVSKNRLASVGSTDSLNQTGGVVRD